MSMTVCQMTQKIEEQTLAKDAMLSQNSRGRASEEQPCPYRTCFQRDRDRILHSNSFRRLKHKTQVFLSPAGDHYRTRLTHTLEVAQLARTIARGLRVNEDLTEAAALGHDLGHTPFGHAGERALNEVCSIGFQHFMQSIRVAEVLERGGRGLNLTFEVKDAIACHTKGQQATTLEGRIIRIADRIAYINHDIEDAIRAGVLEQNDLPWMVVCELGRTKSQRITTLVSALIEDPTRSLRMPDAIQEAFDTLHQFMFDSVYLNPVAKGEEGKAADIVKYLFSYFLTNVDQLPPEYKSIMEQEGAERAVCDYIAGMTDNYAIGMYEELVIPKRWKY